jgi:hypothetical protein
MTTIRVGPDGKCPRVRDDERVRVQLVAGCMAVVAVDGSSLSIAHDDPGFSFADTTAATPTVSGCPRFPTSTSPASVSSATPESPSTSATRPGSRPTCRGKSVTIFDCRAPWHLNLTDWSRVPIAQLRYDPADAPQDVIPIPPAAS